MISKIVLACALIGIALSAPTTCDQARLNKCLTAASKGMHFPSERLPAHVYTFMALVSEMIAKAGPTGYKYFCDVGIQGIVNCLGDQHTACLQPQALMTYGLDEGDAIGYETMFAQFTYACGPGFSVVQQNIKCVMQTFTDHMSDITQCQKTLDTNVMKNPKKGCIYSQEYVDCSAAYFSSCGDATKQTMCSAYAQGVYLMLPMCRMEC